MKGKKKSARFVSRSHSETDAENGIAVPGKDTVTSQVLELARRLQADFLDKIKDTNLTPAQANMLRELHFTPGMSQHELAQRLDIGKVSVGEALTKLENAGYVQRARRADNRRVISVCLTQNGEAVMRQIAAAAQEQIDQLRQRVGSEMIERLNVLLRAVNEMFDDAPAVDLIE